jgi:hypothetical protein
MRALGRLIAFLGLISLLAGGYGYAIVQTSYAPVFTGWVAETYMHFGGFGYSIQHPEFLLRGLQAFMITYRMGLALGGLGGTVIGVVLMKR